MPIGGVLRSLGPGLPAALTHAPLPNEAAIGRHARLIAWARAYLFQFFRSKMMTSSAKPQIPTISYHTIASIPSSPSRQKSGRPRIIIAPFLVCQRALQATRHGVLLAAAKGIDRAHTSPRITTFRPDFDRVALLPALAVVGCAATAGLVAAQHVPSAYRVWAGAVPNAPVSAAIRPSTTAIRISTSR